MRIVWQTVRGITNEILGDTAGLWVKRSWFGTVHGHCVVFLGNAHNNSLHSQ